MNIIKCSVNPSNLVAPVKVNDKFYSKYKKIENNQNVNLKKERFYSSGIRNNILNLNSNILKYNYTPEENFISQKSSYIRPLVPVKVFTKYSKYSKI
jgi:hypothetical protein